MRDDDAMGNGREKQEKGLCELDRGYVLMLEAVLFKKISVTKGSPPQGHLSKNFSSEHVMQKETWALPNFQRIEMAKGK